MSSMARLLLPALMLLALSSSSVAQRPTKGQALYVTKKVFDILATKRSYAKANQLLRNTGMLLLIRDQIALGRRFTILVPTNAAFRAARDYADIWACGDQVTSSTARKLQRTQLGMHVIPSLLTAEKLIFDRPGAKYPTLTASVLTTNISGGIYIGAKNEWTGDLLENSQAKIILPYVVGKNRGNGYIYVHGINKVIEYPFIWTGPY